MNPSRHSLPPAGASVFWKLLFCACLANLVLICGTLSAAEQDTQRLQRGQFLTQASARDAFEVCRDYLMQNRTAKGFESRDLEELEVRNRVFSKHNGVTHLYLRQKFRGIDIEGATYNTAVDREGRMLVERDSLKRKLRGRAIRLLGSHLNARQALRYAALALGESANLEMTVVEVPTGPMKETTVRAPSLSRDDIPLKLNFLELENGALRLAWRIVIRTTDGQDWWNLFIDASSGALLKQVNWMAKETYEVYPEPLESPSVGMRSVVSGVADALASPFGWHDTNGVMGADLQDTRGNNVFAQEDADDDDAGGLRPDGGASLVFTPTINPLLQPSANHEAATVNLFYWNNVLHDVLYQYGFDEAAGNFQQNNYGNGGIAGDAVRADSQDGSGVNNATFATPPDGTPGRMQMYLWVPDASSNLEITAPQSVAGNYEVGDAAFGAWTDGLTGSVVLALDDSNVAGPSNTDGCTSFTNAASVSGNIALVDRGDCFFVEKTANAQAAGALGLIVVNNDGDDVLGMAGQNPALSIPVLLIGQSNGDALKTELSNGVIANMTVVARRDSAFDNGIIAHEYAHGLTMRLTGGAGNSSCLGQTQSSGMGEGWSDWFALTMTATANDSPIIPRPIGTYASSEPVNGPGIRNYPYTRDLGVNPLTFTDIASLNRPHGVGEVWASALWDLYWNLVDAYGFDADLYEGTGGNNLLMQLVVDGLKLQPCNPSFLDARDAIVTADLFDNNGANQCLIWEAFARRGMGESALVSSAGSVAVTEAFDVPANCATQCGNGVQDVGEQCDDGNNFSFDGCAANCRTETVLQHLDGTAAGGQLNLVLDGVGIDVVTTSGQTAEDVAGALVAAVNNNTALQAISSIAANDQGQIVVTGEVEQFDVQDAGLISVGPGVTQVPLHWSWRVALLLIGIAIFVTRIPRRLNSI